MNIPQVKRIWTRPFFVHFKKHHCPVCDGKLKKNKVSKIVNSKSEEAKDYDFTSSGGDGFMIGNVKFIWTEFHCAKCSKNYSINDIFQAEKSIKKPNR